MLEVTLRTSGGEEFTSGQAELEIKRDNGAADIIRLKLKNPIWGKTWSFIEVRLDGEEYFGGIVDEQEYSADSEGEYLTVYGRSYAALLIDNQVRPCTIINPTVRFIEEAYFKPLGFEVIGEALPSGEMIVEKNTSLYRFLENFCRIFIGTKPMVRGRKIYLDDRYLGHEIKLADADRILMITKLYRVFSDIYIRNPVSGAYTLRRSGSDELGYKRVKYTDKPEKVQGKIREYVKVRSRNTVNIYPMDKAKTKEISFTVDSVRLKGNEYGITSEAGGYICG